VLLKLLKDKMAFVRKHWDVNGEQIARIEADPGSATSREDTAVLSYLTLPVDKRSYPLGRFAIGRFEVRDDGHRDTLHTGSVVGDDYQQIAEGVVVEDMVNPDGLYEIYTPM
jgi:hypothetical protein